MEEAQSESIAVQKMLRTLLAKNTNLLGSFQAQMRAASLCLLRGDDLPKSLRAKGNKNLEHAFNSDPEETLLLLGLIDEFLDSMGLTATRGIFVHEAGIDPTTGSRTPPTAVMIAKNLKFADSNSSSAPPMLTRLLRQTLSSRVDGADGSRLPEASNPSLQDFSAVSDAYADRNLDSSGLVSHDEEDRRTRQMLPQTVHSKAAEASIAPARSQPAAGSVHVADSSSVEYSEGTMSEQEVRGAEDDGDWDAVEVVEKPVSIARSSAPTAAPQKRYDDYEDDEF